MMHGQKNIKLCFNDCLFSCTMLTADGDTILLR